VSSHCCVSRNKRECSFLQRRSRGNIKCGCGNISRWHPAATSFVRSGVLEDGAEKERAWPEVAEELAESMTSLPICLFFTSVKSREARCRAVSISRALPSGTGGSVNGA